MSQHKEPIAIIGMGLRLPGAVDEPSKLWDALLAGKSTQGKIPKSRFNGDAFFDERGNHIQGAMAVDGGYFLDEHLQGFENTFFRINNMEATAMDPEQRMLLEVVYECIEDAGVKLEHVAGTNTACYVGNFTYDFSAIQNRDVDHFDRYTATGMGNTILSNRISHTFDLKGPSLTLDTACSSSLYGLHLACTALRGGDCDAAIVAAANLIQSPEQFLATAKAGVLSPTSTCHTFDAAADGYGRGEAVNALYLKRLSKAIEDGDPVHAVIVNTAVNSNGRTAGITLPSHDGQVAVIRHAYEQLGLSMSDTGYVECHGTGTAVGDPIEVEAVASALATDCHEPMLIGSNKPNFGHSETASGLTSIMKVALALQNKVIPPTIGISKLNPKLLLNDWNVRIVQEATPWPTWTTVPRAAINSFGYGGANSHAILEAAEHHLPAGYNSTKTSPRTKSSYIFPFSASNEESLRARVRELSKHSSWHPEDIVACSASRTSLDRRGVVIANSVNAISESSLKISTETRRYENKKPFIIFTGQGAQWPGMAREMFAEHEGFVACLQRLDAVLQKVPHPPNWKLQDFMQSDLDETRIHEVQISQPLCTAVQICLINILRDLGVEPFCVIGHSSGEIAAAYTAGKLSEEQAIVASYYRGYVCAQTSKLGAMLAVGTSSEDAENKILELGLVGKIRVACYNAPENVTLSGDAEAAEQIREVYEASDKLARILKTSGRAYHSHHMELLAAEYHRLMLDVWETLASPKSPTSEVVWVSSVRDEPVTQITPKYWVDNLISPVRFRDAVAKICTDQSRALWIEIGPHNALELPTMQTVLSCNPQCTSTYLSLLLRGKSAVDTFHQAVADLYLLGYNVDFNVANAVPQALEQKRRCRSGFPKYQWSYKKTYNNASQISDDWRQRRYPPHDLLGAEVFKQERNNHIWRKTLRAEHIEWISGHCVENVVVFPAAGYIAMAVEAVRQVEGEDFDTIQIRDMKVSKALVVPTDKTKPGITINTILSSQNVTKGSYETWYKFQIGSRPTADSFTLHAEGIITSARTNEDVDPVSLPLVDYEESAARSWYRKFGELGLNFSGRFRSINRVITPRHRNLEAAKTYSNARTQIQNEKESRYLIHPIDIDSTLQSGLVSTSKGLIKETKAILPVAFKHITLQRPDFQQIDSTKDSWECFARSEAVGFNRVALDASLHDSNGHVVLRIDGCVTAPFQTSLPPLQTNRQPMLRIEWKPDFEAMLKTSSALMPKYIDYVSTNALGAGCLAAIDLIAHKSPQIRVLYLGEASSDTMAQLQEVLCGNSAFERCSILHSGQMVHDKLSIRIAIFAPNSNEELPQNLNYDIVFVANSQNLYLQLFLPGIESLLAPNGQIITECSKQHIKRITSRGFECFYDQTSKSRSSSLLIARKTPLAEENRTSLVGSHVYIVTRDDDDDESIYRKVREQLLRKNVKIAKRVRLSDILDTQLPDQCLIVSLLESSRPLLKTISTEELQSVQSMIARSSTLIWVTRGSLLEGGDPDFALVGGLARTIVMEQPSVKFVTFDLSVGRSIKTDTKPITTLQEPPIIQESLHPNYFDRTLPLNRPAAASSGGVSADSSSPFFEDTSDEESAISATTSVSGDFSVKDDHESLAVQALLGTLSAVHNDLEEDREFVFRDGIVFTSRFVPETTLNAGFRQKQALEAKHSSIDSAGLIKVSVPNVNLTESLVYKQEEQPGNLQSNDVFVKVHQSFYGCIDAAILTGSLPAEDGKLGFVHTAKVSSVGSSVTNVIPEDFVLVLSSSQISNYLVTSEWRCFKVQDHNLDFGALEDYMTALYAVRTCANVQSKDTVLINVGDCGDESTAAVLARVARNVGAFVDINTQDSGKQSSIATSSQQSMPLGTTADSIRALANTSSKSIDVVFNLSSSLSSEIASRVSMNGKVVTIDTQAQHHPETIPNIHQIHLNFRDMFKFDIGPKQHSVLQNLITEAIKLYSCSDNIVARPLQFGISDCSSALQELLRGAGNNKIGIDYTEPATLPIIPLKYDTVLDSSKEYFLVGCLGGLGRSMTRWMFDRGARNFIFMGPSGADRPEARAFVSFLEASGANVKVALGDVADESAVTHAISLAEKPIGGAVHAAMGLDEALFSEMTADQWHKSVRPKLYGAWNIYHALEKHGVDSLDFLLFTSSLTGSVGVATEANYCAANAFLDNFARHLRNGGLSNQCPRIPATAVGLGMISQVGYLHDHEDIEELLVRKGVQAIDEDEFLQIIDLAISTGKSQTRGTETTDLLCASHMVTGLEPLGLLELRKRGFRGVPATFDDPRAKLLAKLFADPLDGAAGGQDAASGSDILSSADSESNKRTKILTLLRQNMSNYLLLPPDEIDLQAPLAHFGIDSMLASAIRMWMHKTFGLLVPFMEFSSSTKSFEGLADDFLTAGK